MIFESTSLNVVHTGHYGNQKECFSFKNVLKHFVRIEINVTFVTYLKHQEVKVMTTQKS